MLNKGKGIILGKLRIITLIEADLQHAIRTHLNNDREEGIEKDRRLSKSNCSLKNNYSIESVALEK